MKKVLMVCAVCMVCLFPALSRADCDGSTKACDDAKANASRCNTQWGFRAEVMCETQNKASLATCAQADKDCKGTSGTVLAPGQKSNQ
jgi:hypothetical protein